MSVLVPAWNAGATVRVCLESVRRQVFTDWECVVVDDGSSDKTATLVREVMSHDARVRLISRPHHGLVPALNEGLGHCRAPLIARMDADDVMHRLRLGAQMAALDHDPRLAAVGCHARIFPRTTMSPRLREYEAWLNSMQSADDVTREAFVECPVAHPTLMMRRDMARLGYVDQQWPEDYDLILRALASGLHIGMVPRRLLAWRARADSWSRTSAAYDVERFAACKAHYLAHGFLAGTESFVLWGYGATGRMLRKALASHGKTPSHIVEVKRSRVGQRIHGAPVIPVAALAALGDHRIVVSVARLGPRSEIRNALASMGFVEGQDFVCAA
ncbi:MAG TPA: glycosyltransferase family 2 protein [Vicinamibacterales bacterium]|nr:glycosyltransferase family 2 protein [Vicinamibacterales bacterium]